MACWLRLPELKAIGSGPDLFIKLEFSDFIFQMGKIDILYLFLKDLQIPYIILKGARPHGRTREAAGGHGGRDGVRTAEQAAEQPPAQLGQHPDTAQLTLHE